MHVKKLIQKLALGTMIASLGYSSAMAATATSVNTEQSVFFMQSAQHVLLKPGMMKLYNLAPQTLWFADAPSTQTGSKSIAEYMQLWSSSNGYFYKNNPNAILVGYIKNKSTHNEQKVTIIAKLKTAQYKDGNIVYTIDKSLLIPDNKTVMQQVVLSHASLFVDTYTHITPGGQGPYGG